MYRNSRTTELVQICWIHADQLFPTDDLSQNGGEELFVLEGSLVVVGGEEFGKWGWLRFPVGGDECRVGIKAGKEGARIYRKTGHLCEHALSMEKLQITQEV
jgi:hypothetical protein